MEAQKSYGARRVAFDKEYNLQIWPLRDTSYYRFTLTLNEIDSADVLMQNKILSIPNNKKEEVKKYYRQYVGVKMGNIRYIFVYAWYRKEEQFLQNIVEVQGGGHLYFQSKIDIDNKAVIEFEFNDIK